MGKMWCQHETTHWKGLQRTANIVHTLFWLFTHGLEDQQPIKKTIEDPSLNVFEQCSKRATSSVPQTCPKRSGSPSSAGRARNPATPQTTAVERVRLVEKMARGEKKPCRDAESEGATDDTGGEKVGTKKGTTKFGLPCNWLTNPMLVTEIGGKPRSEAARSKAWECKLDTNVVGTPPATLEASGTFIVDVVCVAASAYLTAATTEAKKAKNGSSGTLVRCDGLPNIVRRRRRNFWDGTRSQSGQSWIQRQKPAARLLFVLRWDMLLVKNGV